ncbi:MAG TPA: ABC transporter permease [Kineosporiaceae bacterium]|nr:ABC transporter permease [Kineosporiaceae bacterium]
MAVITRHQAVLIRRAPGATVGYTLMPVVLTVFLEPVQARLAAPGPPGIVRAAPGMIVMFSLFMMGVIGDGLLNERIWRTSSRLRTTPARAGEILIGRAIPLLAALLAQQAAVLAFAAAAYHLDVGRAGRGLAAVGPAWAMCVLGCGTLLASLVRSHGQLGPIKDVATLVLAGLGGALVPPDALPSWVAPLAPISPGYWAMGAFTSVLTPGAPAPIRVVLALVAIGLAGFALAAAAFARQDR